MADTQIEREPENNSNARLNRRQLLLRSASIAGAVLAYPLFSSVEAAAAQSLDKSGSSATAGKGGPTAVRTPHTIGVLLPASALYPQLIASFTAGMNLYLSSVGRSEISITTQKVGSSGQGAAQAAAALVQKQGAEVLVSMLSPSRASLLQSQLQSTTTALLTSTLGENVPRTADMGSNIFYHTLNMWQSNWALGNWAAHNLGTRAVIASSFYDAGFDALYAFRMGFSAAGGQVAAVQVTNRPGDTLGLAPLLATVHELRPDFVFAHYCGQSAADLLATYSKSGLGSTIPLVGSAFLTSSDVLKTAGAAAGGVKTAASWVPANKPGSVSAFADAFTVLGYEAAGLVLQALDGAAGNGRQAMLSALASAQFTGPRGTIAMNGSTHSTSGPIFLQQVQQTGGAWSNTVVTQLPSSAEQDPQLADLQQSTKTGWSSTYLC